MNQNCLADHFTWRITQLKLPTDQSSQQQCTPSSFFNPDHWTVQPSSILNCLIKHSTWLSQNWKIWRKWLTPGKEVRILRIFYLAPIFHLAQIAWLVGRQQGKLSFVPVTTWCILFWNCIFPDTIVPITVKDMPESSKEESQGAKKGGRGLSDILLLFALGSIAAYFISLIIAFLSLVLYCSLELPNAKWWMGQFCNVRNKHINILSILWVNNLSFF